ncbi:RNase H family protein [Methylorubrum extorquens]
MAVARHVTVTWTWVRGHAGHELNERVDEIAAAQAEIAHGRQGADLHQRPSLRATAPLHRGC